MALSPWQTLSGQRVRKISRWSARADDRRDGGVLKVCTINVGSLIHLIGKGREIVALLARRTVDICCLQEVRYRNQGCTSFGENEEKFKFWYSGGQDKVNGVGIMMKKELADSVFEIKRYDDRMMKIRMVVGKRIWNIFSIYAPQSGRPVQEKIDFWEKLEDEVGQTPESEVLLIGGDVNGHIGWDNTGYEEIMGCNGHGNRNAEGETVLDFCKFHKLNILNTYFKKGEEKLITYKSGDHRTQIDLILLRKSRGIVCTDCHTLPGEECVTQHRPVRATISVADFHRRGFRGKKKIKLWKLKDQDNKRECQEKFWRKMEHCHGDMEMLQKQLKIACEEVCGLTTGRRCRERETWWWNNSVQDIIREKRAAFKKWQRSGGDADREEYRRKSREAKRRVGEAKQEAWREWSEDLNTAEGRNKLFRVASQMRKDKKDIQGTCFIKDENNNIVVEQNAVADRWRRYFHALLNEEYENQIEICSPVEGPIEDITEEDVGTAISKLKNRRATGPSGVAAEMFKAMEGVGVQEVTLALRETARLRETPSSWKNSTTIALYKGKGDALACANFRGLRLLEHGMKILEKVLDAKLRKIVKIGGSQFGFRPGKSTEDAIFIVRQLQEKYTEKKRKLYHVFVDLEKAFDRIPRKAIEWALRRQLVPEYMVELVMMLYLDSRSRVSVAGVQSLDFPIEVGVHQGSALSPLLFILVMQEATKDCGGEDIWELLYADDLVLTAESREEVELKFLNWKHAIEIRGMKVNIGKTKMMVTGKKDEVVRSGRYPCGVCDRGVGQSSILCTSCHFWCHKRCSGLKRLSGNPNFQCPACIKHSEPKEEEKEDIFIDGHRIEEVRQFCYLGDLLDSEGGVERAVRMRVSAAWQKWREISSLLTNRSIPLWSRGRAYDACIRPVLLYGSEGWPMTDRLRAVLTGCDRRLLRYMAGITWRDHVSSAEVADRCGVELLEGVLRRRRLRWYGHVARRDIEEPLGNILNFEAPGRRPPGRPKKSWKRTVEEDMRVVGAKKEDALDRDRWKCLIKRQTP